MNDPDYIDPARIAKLRAEQPDAGAKPSHPRVHRPASSGVSVPSKPRVTITGSRVREHGLTVTSEGVSVTR